jgi:hypothetical protein
MAREAGGGVQFWMELPISELLKYVVELNNQLRAEQAAAEKQG